MEDYFYDEHRIFTVAVEHGVRVSRTCSRG